MKVKLKYLLNNTIIVFLICYLIRDTCALFCYKCTANEVESDCEIDVKAIPKEQSILKCKAHQKYCTIRRQEMNSMKGKVLSFARNCETRPHLINKVITDDQYTTYFVACQEDLCNDGDGTAHKITNQNNNAHKPPLPAYEEFIKSSGNNANRFKSCMYMVMLSPISIIVIIHLNML